MGRKTGGTWAAALLAIAGVGCAGSEDPGLGVGAVKTHTPAATFAPLVSLHPRERLLPLAAAAFLARSSLRWHDGDCGDATVAGRSATPTRPRLEQSRLGGGGAYRHSAGRLPGCRPTRRYASDEYTRPYDPSRTNGLQMDEGFYLDLADGAREGAPAIARPDGRRLVRAPAYVERDVRRRGEYTMVRLTYWMLFGMERRPGPAAVAATSHEGDWRWVRILLRTREGAGEYVPVGVRYGVRSTYLPWRAVRRATDAGPRSTHPAIFVARGGHDLFPRPGRYTRKIAIGERELDLRQDALACPRCTAWPTWRNLLDARRQPWHGYGGAWGETLGARTTPAGLGPGPWGDYTKDQLLPPGDTG